MKNNLIDFTVIIPVYNTEKYLTECIDSVIAQQSCKIEIIAVDDCSLDSSLTILNSYKDRLRNHSWVILDIVNLKQNMGPAIARNIAMKKAKGEFVVFIDSDDYFAENAFVTILDNLKKNTADIIVFPFLLWRESTNVLETQFPQDKKLFSEILMGKSTKVTTLTCHPELLTLKNYTCNKIYRRKFLQKHHIEFPNIRLHEDIPFHWHVLLNANKIIVIAQPIYIYRIFPRETGQQASNKFDEQRFDIFEALQEVDSVLHCNNSNMRYYKYFLYFKLDVLQWINEHLAEDLLNKFYSEVHKSMGLLTNEEANLQIKGDKNLKQVIFKLNNNLEGELSRQILTTKQLIGVYIFSTLFLSFNKTHRIKLTNKPVEFFQDSRSPFTRTIGRILKIL